MNIRTLTTKVASELNLPYDYVWKIYQSYWKGVRKYMSSLPLKQNLTEEEFSKLQTSINIPSLGKFHIEWDKLQNKKNNERYKNKKA